MKSKASISATTAATPSAACFGRPSTSAGIYAKPTLSPAKAARKAVLKRIQRQEIRRLQKLVPCIANRPAQLVTDIDVIEQTVRYIDQLHATILARVAAGSLSADALSQLSPAAMTRFQPQLPFLLCHAAPSTTPRDNASLPHPERLALTPLNFCSRTKSVVLANAC